MMATAMQARLRRKGVLQAGQIERAGHQGAQDEHAFVNHSDAAYTVHQRELYPRK